MRLALLALLLLPALCLRAADIAVVHPVLSVAPTERAYAKALAGHVARWYAQAGVEADLVADDALGTRPPHRLLILVDCYDPPPATLAALRRARDAGARLVVCYSGSDALARLLGLRTVGYRREPGRCREMAFGPGRPVGAPTLIRQTSDNRFDVAPASPGSATPIAWWRDGLGRRVSAAWWRSPGGHLWMTHVLTGDGDEAGKRRLLLAIAAEIFPGVWARAARAALDDAEAPLRDGTLANRLGHAPDGAATLALLRAQRDAAHALIPQDAAKAYQAALDLRALVARAYAQTLQAPLGEVRAVWDHSGQGLWPGDWERTAALLARSGVTDLYVNVAGAAFALYPSRVLQQKGTRDELAAAIAAGRRHGLRVHAWILAFSCERAANPAVIADFRKRGWTLQEPDGTPLNWLDPTHPAVRAHLLEAVREIARRRPDGIHLDFIRFPGLQQSLGPGTRARFEAARGPAPGWPACVTDPKGARRADFLRWRATCVTDAVQGVRAWLRANAPDIALSAAVYGKYPACVDSVGQDWLLWLRTGLLDAACPMNYTEDPARLRDWLGTQTADPRLAARIICGIGVTAAESRLSPLDTLRQIEAARETGCRGFALFDLDEALRSDILSLLKPASQP